MSFIKYAKYPKSHTCSAYVLTRSFSFLKRVKNRSLKLLPSVLPNYVYSCWLKSLSNLVWLSPWDIWDSSSNSCSLIDSEPRLSSTRAMGSLMSSILAGGSSSLTNCFKSSFGADSAVSNTSWAKETSLASSTRVTSLMEAGSSSPVLGTNVCSCICFWK